MIFKGRYSQTNLSPNYGGVVNDGDGNLSGYAWGENVGWINFAPMGGGVTIDDEGKFDGWAWGENIGWIHFNNLSIPYKAQTAWTPPIPLEPVDDLVDTSVGGTRYNRRTGQFSCNVTVTNISETVINSPVWLVVVSISPDSIPVMNPDGFTGEGKPYFDLTDLLGDGALSPGESVVKRIYFDNPNRLRFTFESSVYGLRVD